jgi:hypothetical protein
MFSFADLSTIFFIHHIHMCPLLPTHSIWWNQRLDGGNVAAGAELSRTPRRARQIQRPTRHPFSPSSNGGGAPVQSSLPPSSSSRCTLPPPPHQSPGASTSVPPPEEATKNAGPSGYLHPLICAPQADTPAAIYLVVTSRRREAPAPGFRAFAPGPR